ncbi:MAG: acyltransferase family protein [Streptosporangiales bacterium]|nr:acyltransferase family protein [Streptosporangiales bacterium]
MSRHPWFDNVRFLAVLLVVLGHAIAPLMHEAHLVRGLYAWIYAFHMPLFVFISGHLARSMDFTPRRLRGLLTGVLVPYLVFDAAYSLLHHYVTDSGPPLSPLDPAFLTWFLLSLFCWRLTAPFWRVIRYPVVVSVVIAVLAGLTDLSGPFDWPRTFYFLPFFVMGLFTSPKRLQILRRRAFGLAAAALMGIALMVAYVASPHMSMGWFLTESYDGLGVSPWAGMGMRLVLIGCATVMSCAFMALVPRRRLWITGMGAFTIYAYLLHGFPRSLGVKLGWYDVFDHNPLGIVALAVGSLLFGALLMTPPVRALFRPLVEPAWPARLITLPAEEKPQAAAPADPSPPPPPASPARELEWSGRRWAG